MPPHLLANAMIPGQSVCVCFYFCFMFVYVLYVFLSQAAWKGSQRNPRRKCEKAKESKEKSTQTQQRKSKKDCKGEEPSAKKSKLIYDEKTGLGSGGIVVPGYFHR